MWGPAQRVGTRARHPPPAGSKQLPAVLFRYTLRRRDEQSNEHLIDFRGILRAADAYAGFKVNRTQLSLTTSPQIQDTANPHIS